MLWFMRLLRRLLCPSEPPLSCTAMAAVPCSTSRAEGASDGRTLPENHALCVTGPSPYGQCIDCDQPAQAASPYGPLCDACAFGVPAFVGAPLAIVLPFRPRD